MTIKKRTLVYLTTSTEVWIEPWENDCSYLELVTHLDGGRKIDAALSAQRFPKALLEHQIGKMCEKIGIPFLDNCLTGRWGFKKVQGMHRLSSG